MASFTPFNQPLSKKTYRELAIAEIFDELGQNSGADFITFGLVFGEFFIENDEADSWALILLETKEFEDTFVFIFIDVDVDEDKLK